MKLLEDSVRLSAAPDESSPVMPMPAAAGGVEVAYTTIPHPPPSPLHRIRQRHSTFGRERVGPAHATIREGIVPPFHGRFMAGVRVATRSRRSFMPCVEMNRQAGQNRSNRHPCSCRRHRNRSWSPSSRHVTFSSRERSCSPGHPTGGLVHAKCHLPPPDIRPETFQLGPAPESPSQGGITRGRADPWHPGGAV